VPNEKNSRLGSYISTTTAGETVRAFLRRCPRSLASILVGFTKILTKQIKRLDG